MLVKTTVRKLFVVALGWCMCLFVFGCLPCGAQNITTRVINLPRPLQRNILSMSKDDDGFLWFRNSQGIWRFDGTDAVLFNIAKLKLKANETIYLFFCFDHFLMVLDAKNNLHAYDQLNDTAYIFKFGPEQIYNFAPTLNNELLFFNSTGQGYLFSRKHLVQTGPDLHKLKGWRNNMFVAACAIEKPSNRLYLFLRDWVAYVKGDSLVSANLFGERTYPYSYHFATNQGFDITSRYLLLSHAHGFVLYDKNTLKALKVYEGLDIANRIVAGDSIIFLAKKQASDFTADLQSPLFKLENPLFAGSFNIYTILPTDFPGKYIAATDVGLFELTCNRQKTDTFYNKPLLVASFRNKSIRGILRYNNQLYVGTYSGIYKYNGQTVKQLLPLRLVYSMAATDKNTLMWGVENREGLATYNTADEKSNVLFKGELINAVRCLYKYNNQFWGGTDLGLLQLYQDGDTWVKHLWFGDTTLGFIRQITNKAGDWYFATQNGFFRLSKNRQLTKLYPKNDAFVVYAFTEMDDGFILATQGKGIVWVDGNGNIKSSYLEKDGLAGNYAYSLVRSGNLLVAGCSAGPSVFLIAGQTLKPVPIRHDDDDGIFDQECNHGAFFDDTVSHLTILGGLEGLMFIDEDYYKAHATDKPGNVLLSYIKLVGDIGKPPALNLFAYASNKIVVPPKQSFISLKFASPLHFNQSEAFMRIKGINDNWQSFKLADEVNLVALPPGEYTLQARLGESQDEKYWFTKTLVVLPAFYQTWGFNLLVIAASLALLGYIVYFFWRSKVRKLEAEQQLRAVIASDLHDDIGSTLNSISVYAEIAGQQLQADSAKAKVLLDKMGVASRGMIETMSDIVWTVNPKNDDFDNVLKRMQFFAGELLSGKNILLRFELDEKGKKLKFTMQERKNIYLIYKEAVNNVFKYSEATAVNVSIVKDGQHLTITIADNGKGFDVEERRNSGNGLTNMRNRAKEIGGKILIESEKGSGTTVCLRVKLY